MEFVTLPIRQARKGGGTLRFLRNRRGVGLVDVMVTVAVACIAGAIFGTAFPSGISTIRQSGDNAIATSIAQKKFEQLRALGYESINYTIMRQANPPIIDEGDGSLPYTFTGIDSLAGQLPGATGTINVTDESATVKRIVITVNYSGPNNRTRNVVLRTLISDQRPKVGS